jgi:hypothetical protein
MRTALALAALVLAPTAAAQTITPGPGIFPSESVDHEPLVIHDVSGGTLAGPIHSHAVVWSDGSITFSERSTNFIFPVTETTRVVAGHAPKSEATRLIRQLRRLGAFDESDSAMTVSDVPLQTLTVALPGTDSRSNSFSFYLAAGRKGPMLQLINAFLDAYLPPAPTLSTGGGGGGGSSFAVPTLPVSDIPMETVSLMRGLPRSPTHTFSFLGGTQAHRNVAQIIGEFIQSSVLPELQPLTEVEEQRL